MPGEAVRIHMMLWPCWARLQQQREESFRPQESALPNWYWINFLSFEYCTRVAETGLNIF